MLGSWSKKLRKFDLFVVCIHLIVFSGLMVIGLNVGFVFGSQFIPLLGSGTWGDITVSVVSGSLVGIGSYGLFIKTERAVKAILSKDSLTEVIIRMTALVLVVVGFVMIGILGLAYRLEFFQLHGVIFVFWIGVIFEVCNPLFGLILHPMQHPPAEIVEEDLFEDFEREHVENVVDRLNDMDIGKQHRAFVSMRKGDPRGVRDVLEDELEEEQAAEQARRRVRTNKQTKKGFRAFTADEPTAYEEEEVNFTAAPPEKQNGRISR